MLPVLHDIWPPKFVSGATTLYINGLDSLDPQPGIEALMAMAGGSVNPLLYATAFTEPKVKMTARDLQAILAGVSITNGWAIDTSATIPYEKRANGGDYAGAGTNFTLTGTQGLLYVEEFGAKQDDKEGADVVLTYCATWDGTNLPLVTNVSQNLTGTPGVAAIHALGPCNFQGIIGGLPGVTSVRVKTGIEVKFVRADGELHPRIVVIIKRVPTIEVELFNIPIANTLTLGSIIPLSSNFTCSFQKCVAGGARVPYATAEHVVVTVAAGAYKLESMSGNKTDNASLKLTVLPTGTLAINTASAITLAS